MLTSRPNSLRYDSLLDQPKQVMNFNQLRITRKPFGVNNVAHIIHFEDVEVTPVDQVVGALCLDNSSESDRDSVADE